MAEQLLTHRLHEREERRLELILRRLGDDGDLERDHVEHPGAVAHLLGEVAQPVDVVAAPHALQIHRAAAERARAQLVKEGQQLVVGDHLHRLRDVGADVVVEPALADEAPALLHGRFKVHIVVAAHGQVVGQVLGGAEVAGVAVLVGEHGVARGDIHPDAHVEAVAQRAGERALAVDQRRAARIKLCLQRLHLFRALQARIAVLVAAAVEQHGIDLAVHRQIRLQHVGDLLRGLQQVERVHERDGGAAVLARALLAQHVDQRLHVRAGVDVDAHALARAQQPGDGAGDVMQSAHGRHAHAGDGVDRLGIAVGIGMEHEAHRMASFFSSD